jgi:hypothetical protein
VQPAPSPTPQVAKSNEPLPCFGRPQFALPSPLHPAAAGRAHHPTRRRIPHLQCLNAAAFCFGSNARLEVVDMTGANAIDARHGHLDGWTVQSLVARSLRRLGQSSGCRHDAAIALERPALSPPIPSQAHVYAIPCAQRTPSSVHPMGVSAALQDRARACQAT